MRAYALAGALVSGIGVSGLGVTGAAAQTDLNAGKSPAQMFSSDCSACHRSASGLTRGRDPGTVARFLREHYTSNPNNAGALAGYLAGAGGGAAPADPRGRQRPQSAVPEERAPGQPPAQPAVQRQRPPAPPQEGEAAAPGAVPPTTAQQRRAAAAERLASAPIERLRPYIAAHDPAKPATPGEADRMSRLNDYATAGIGAEALRAAALAGRPAAAEPPARPAERTDDRNVAAPTPVDAHAGTTPAPAAAPETPTLSGPPVGSTAPSRQSNPD